MANIPDSYYLALRNTEEKYKQHQRLEQIFQAEEEIVEALTLVGTGWDGSSPVDVTTPNCWKFISSGGERDQMVKVLAPPFLPGEPDEFNPVEGDMLMLAALLIDSGEFGWEDLDPYGWEIQVEMLTKDDPWQVDRYQLTIRCTDWA